MKVVIVTHKCMRGDGQGRVNYEVTWEAIRRGYYVTILASEIASELEKHERVNWVCISVKGWPTEFFRNLVFSWQSSNWLCKNRGQLNLVKVNGAITNFPGSINAVHFVHSAWLRSPQHIFSLRRDLYGFYQWIYTVFNARWEKQAFERAKVIIAVSKKVANELIEIGVPPERIKTILNGVDVQEFCPGKSDRSQLGLPEGKTLALFAGDIRTPRKNLDSVLQALVKVPDLSLVVAGSTQGSPYPLLAKQLGISDRVHFLGFRQDISAIMKAVDMFVFPSRYEACTLALLEAMASGLPVITANTTGGSEIVTSDCGIVLNDSEDIAILAKAMELLTNNYQLRLQMGRASRSIAEKYTWKTIAAGYLDLFDNLKTFETFPEFAN